MDYNLYLDWMAHTFNWLTRSSSSPAIISAPKKNENPWLPEGLCVISQLALLNLWPHGYASKWEWPKGVKIGFSKHSLEIYPPNLSQKLTRMIWPAKKEDLIKLPSAIMTAIFMWAPNKIADEVDLQKRSITDLLNDNQYHFTAITRIYLRALHSIKGLAVTYGYDDNKLSNKVNEIEDAVELKYLKHSFQILNNALHGFIPHSKELQAIGIKAKENWSAQDFQELDRHIGIGMQYSWESADSETEQIFGKNLIKTKERRFIALCQEQCLAVIDIEEVSNYKSTEKLPQLIASTDEEKPVKTESLLQEKAKEKEEVKKENPAEEPIKDIKDYPIATLKKNSESKRRVG